MTGESVVEAVGQAPLWQGFLLSPGFGGLAALLAALVAGAVAASVARRDRLQRERTDRKNQWWTRAQWALDATTSDRAWVRVTGFRMLEALAESEWADEHEADVVAAATAPSLSGPSPVRRVRRILGGGRST
ncbi:hypothetical protein [Aquipuribacter nitratireducens]|uniref:Uncharacterized protein n=1 Tax=Aquipuribacter nitratireducens TaxID=650104 RepID=A0ABW0GJ02_9MICO